MGDQINFYAPYQMPDGSWIYGVAAANKRMSDAGGFNNFSFGLVKMGIQLGYQQAVRDFQQRRGGNFKSY